MLLFHPILVYFREGSKYGFPVRAVYNIKMFWLIVVSILTVTEVVYQSLGKGWCRDDNGAYPPHLLNWGVADEASCQESCSGLSKCVAFSFNSGQCMLMLSPGTPSNVAQSPWKFVEGNGAVEVTTGTGDNQLECYKKVVVGGGPSQAPPTTQNSTSVPTEAPVVEFDDSLSNQNTTVDALPSPFTPPVVAVVVVSLVIGVLVLSITAKQNYYLLTSEIPPETIPQQQPFDLKTEMEEFNFLLSGE